MARADILRCCDDGALGLRGNRAAAASENRFRPLSLAADGIVDTAQLPF
jgi:hypothetical protein